MKAWGLSIDFVKKKIDEGDVIGLLSSMARHGLDVAAATQIFGEDGARAALILTQNSSKYREFAGDLDDIEGSMKRAAAIMGEGLPGAVNALKSAFETAIVALGDAGLTGHLKKMAEAASEAVQWFQDLETETKALVASSLALGPALLAVGAALKVVSIALGGVLFLARPFTALGAALGPPGDRSLAGRLAKFGRVLGPVGVAATALYVAWTPVSTFSKGWRTALKAIPPA